MASAEATAGDAHLTEMERARLARLEENKAKMEQLGLTQMLEGIKAQDEERRAVKRQAAEERRTRKQAERAAAVAAPAPKRSSGRERKEVNYNEQKLQKASGNEEGAEAAPEKKRRNGGKAAETPAPKRARIKVEGGGSRSKELGWDPSFGMPGQAAQDKAEAEAERIGSTLSNPSFIKEGSMSIIGGGFWCNMPAKFGRAHMGEYEQMVTVKRAAGEPDPEGYAPDASANERSPDGTGWDPQEECWTCKYNINTKIVKGKETRTYGLSGGWGYVAKDLQLAGGDQMVFELTKPPDVPKGYQPPAADQKKGRGEAKVPYFGCVLTMHTVRAWDYETPEERAKYKAAREAYRSAQAAGASRAEREAAAYRARGLEPLPPVVKKEVKKEQGEAPPAAAAGQAELSDGPPPARPSGKQQQRQQKGQGGGKGKHQASLVPLSPDAVQQGAAKGLGPKRQKTAQGDQPQSGKRSRAASAAGDRSAKRRRAATSEAAEGEEPAGALHASTSSATAGSGEASGATDTAAAAPQARAKRLTRELAALRAAPGTQRAKAAAEAAADAPASTGAPAPALASAAAPLPPAQKARKAVSGPAAAEIHKPMVAASGTGSKAAAAAVVGVGGKAATVDVSGRGAKAVAAATISGGKPKKKGGAEKKAGEQRPTAAHREHHAPKPAQVDECGVAHWRVERILDIGTTGEGQMRYLIRWLGFGGEYDSWEPAECLDQPMECYILADAAMAKLMAARAAPVGAGQLRPPMAAPAAGVRLPGLPPASPAGRSPRSTSPAGGSRRGKASVPSPAGNNSRGQCAVGSPAGGSVESQPAAASPVGRSSEEPMAAPPAGGSRQEQPKVAPPAGESSQGKAAAAGGSPGYLPAGTSPPAAGQPAPSAVAKSTQWQLMPLPGGASLQWQAQGLPASASLGEQAAGHVAGRDQPGHQEEQREHQVPSVVLRLMAHAAAHSAR